MTHPSPTRRSSDLSCVSIRECTRELGRHHFFSQCHQMQRAVQWLTGDFLDDVAVYPEPERFGHLIILELIGQHDQMRIRKPRSEEHTSELQSLMRISYAVFCLKKKKNTYHPQLIRRTNIYHTNQT